LLSDEKKSAENILKSEAEIWPFRACAVKIRNISLVIGTIWSLCSGYEADITFHRVRMFF